MTRPTPSALGAASALAEESARAVEQTNGNESMAADGMEVSSASCLTDVLAASSEGFLADVLAASGEWAGGVDLLRGAAPTRAQLLIVDDQPLNIRLMHEIFQAEHEVFVATSGEAALLFCRTQLPDLILLDVLMPGLDGYEVCRRLKRDIRTREIPVIFVTSHSDSAEEEDGLAAGAVDFIAKTASANVMRARVNTLITLKRQTDLLRSLAMVDALTGLANRRHFDDRLSAEWRRCGRSGKPLSLILIDIDHFKRFNDCYGHPAGDVCLKQVADCLKAAFSRSHDLVARYGGEEFVCVLPETPLVGAEKKAQVLEGAVRALRIVNEKSDVADGIVTISLGVATALPNKFDDHGHLLSGADRSLYMAKDAGRGQVKSLQI
jgi:diguanylate cyclase (GGDEF)-like protein